MIKDMFKGLDFKKLMINVKNKPESMRGNKLLPCIIMLCGLFLCLTLSLNIFGSHAAEQGDCSSINDKGGNPYSSTMLYMLSGDTLIFQGEGTIDNDFAKQFALANVVTNANVKKITFDSNVGTGITLTSGYEMFYDINDSGLFPNLKEIDLSKVDMSSVTTIENMFERMNSNAVIETIKLPNDLSSCTNFNGAFYACNKLKNVTMPKDMSSANTFRNTFYGCNEQLTEIDLTGLKGVRVFDKNGLSGTFEYCNQLEHIYTSNDLRISGAKSLDYLFSNDSELSDDVVNNFITKVDLSDLTSCIDTFSYLNVTYLDLRNNNFSNKYFGICDDGDYEYKIKGNLYGFFNGCTKLKKVDWTFNPAGIEVKNMAFMFTNTNNIDMTLDFSKMDFSACTGNLINHGDDLVLKVSNIILPTDSNKVSSDIGKVKLEHYTFYDSEGNFVRSTNGKESLFVANDGALTAKKNRVIYSDSYKVFYENEEIDCIDLSSNKDGSILGRLYNDKFNDKYFILSGSSPNGNVSFYNNLDYNAIKDQITYIYFANVNDEDLFVPTDLSGLLYDLPNLSFGYNPIFFDECDLSKLNKIDNFFGGTTYADYLDLSYLDLSNVDTSKINNFVDLDNFRNLIPPCGISSNKGIYVGDENHKLVNLEEGFYGDFEYDLNDSSYFTNYIKELNYIEEAYISLGELLRSTDDYDFYFNYEYDKKNKRILKDCSYTCIGKYGSNDVCDVYFDEFCKEYYGNNDSGNGNMIYRGYCIEYNDSILLFGGEQSIDGPKNIESMFGWDYDEITEVYFADEGFIAHDLTEFCANCQSLETFDGTNLDATEVTSMARMFDDCSILNKVKFDNRYNISNCSDFNYMFWFCVKLGDIDLSCFEVPSTGTNVLNMFDSHSATGLRSLDISNMDFSNNNDNDMGLSDENVLELIKLPKKVNATYKTPIPNKKWYVLDSNFNLISIYDNDLYGNNLIGQNDITNACYLSTKYVDAQISSNSAKYKDEVVVKSNYNLDKLLTIYDKKNGTFDNITKIKNVAANIDYSYLYNLYGMNLDINITDDFLHEIGNGFDVVDFDNDGVDDYLFVYITDLEENEKFLDYVEQFHLIAISDNACAIPVYVLGITDPTYYIKASIDKVSNNINSFADFVSIGEGGLVNFMEPYTVNALTPDIELASSYYDVSDMPKLNKSITKNDLEDIKDYMISHEDKFLLTNLEVKEDHITWLTCLTPSNSIIINMFPLHVTCDAYIYDNEFKLSDLDAGTHTLELRHKDYEKFSNSKLGISNPVSVTINKLKLNEEGTNNKLIAKIDGNGIETIDKDTFDKSKINEYISNLKVYYLNNANEEKLLEVNKDYKVNHYENDDKCIIEIVGIGSCEGSFDFKIGDPDAKDPEKPKNDPNGGNGGNDKPNDKPSITTATIAIGGSTSTISGFVNGYSDNSFKPNKSITRGEFSKMVASLQDNFSLNDVTNLNSTNKYTDVSTKKYYAPYIGFLTKCKVINGYTDKTFKPEANITRAEVCQILTNMYVLNKINNNTNYDKEIDGKWYEQSVRKMIEADLVKGYPDGKFKPDEAITRAEVVALLNRIRNVTYKEITDYQKNYIKANYSDIDEKAWYYKDLCYALTNTK